MSSCIILQTQLQRNKSYCIPGWVFEIQNLIFYTLGLSKRCWATLVSNHTLFILAPLSHKAQISTWYLQLQGKPEKYIPEKKNGKIGTNLGEVCLDTLTLSLTLTLSSDRKVSSVIPLTFSTHPRLLIVHDALWHSRNTMNDLFKEINQVLEQAVIRLQKCQEKL